MTLKDKVKELCKEERVSMNVLEGELGFAKGYLSKLDKSTPNVANLQKIADYFHVTLDYLVNSEAGMMKDSKEIMMSRISSFALEDLSVLDGYCRLSDGDKRTIRDMIAFLEERRRRK